MNTLRKEQIAEYQSIHDDASRLIGSGNWRAAEARCNDAADYWLQVIEPRIPADKRHRMTCLKLAMTIAACFQPPEKALEKMQELCAELEIIAA